MEQGKINMAILSLRKLARDFPNDSEIRITLADALVKVGKIREAIRELESAIHEKPQDADLHLRLAILFQSQSGEENINRAIKAKGEFKETESIYKQLLKKKPIILTPLKI